jgi:uncharacterized protein (DUF1501 family)
MVAQGLWEHVAIAIASDFGRSITANGLGTDHAWGGHYPLISGGLAGGKIHGDYWPDLSAASPINLGRGRMIPGLPWDAQWHAIAQWMGVRPPPPAAPGSSITWNDRRRGAVVRGLQDVLGLSRPRSGSRSS